MALSPRPRRARAREGWPLSHRRSIATSRSPASRDVAHARRRTRTRSHKCDRAHLPSTSHDGTRAVALTAPAPDARGEALALDSTPTSRAFVDAQSPARRLARRRSMRTNTFAFVTADVVAFDRPSPRRSRARVVARSRASRSSIYPNRRISSSAERRARTSVSESKYCLDHLAICLSM